MGFSFLDSCIDFSSRRLREKLLQEEEVEESKFEVGEESFRASVKMDAVSHLTDWEKKIAAQDAEAEARRLRIEKVIFRNLFFFFSN